jgi:lipopolysaccharide export LptBFGC system permease protein LptF|tara:strand:- start:1282 stop:1515 length:234 start_codon:yes stop_codon:yes gene_type:complete
MASIEIHIKNNEIEKIEGHDAYVYIYDHDINKTTTMIFKTKADIYETWTITDTSGSSYNHNNEDEVSGNGDEQSDNI